MDIALWGIHTILVWYSKYSDEFSYHESLGFRSSDCIVLEAKTVTMVGLEPPLGQVASDPLDCRHVLWMRGLYRACPVSHFIRSIMTPTRLILGNPT